MMYWNHHFVVCASFREISWIINETLQLSRSYHFYEQNPLEIKNTIFLKKKKKVTKTIEIIKDFALPNVITIISYKLPWVLFIVIKQ